MTDESFGDIKGKPSWKDGAELAFWDTSAALVQTWGVTLTSAVHAGVIICLATGFVPILSWAMMSLRPRAAEVLGCSAALVGAVLIALDGTSISAAGAVFLNGGLGGDALTALAALLYAVSMVRIHQKTQGERVSSTRLAVDKVFFAALMSLAWAIGEYLYYAFVVGQGALGATYTTWENCFSAEQWLLILFISVGPSALSNVLQFKALSNLKPSEGQVILSTVPIWAIFFSFLVGGSMVMGPKAMAGFAMICLSFAALFSVALFED